MRGKFRTKKNRSDIVLSFPMHLKEDQEQDNSTALKPALHFTKKEIETLPEELKNFITVEIKIPVRQKPNGVYEARYRAHGLNLYAASADYKKLKAKFFKVLLDYKPKSTEPEQQLTASTAHEFAEVCRRWLDLKRAAIKENTFEDYVSIFNTNIFPVLEGRTLDEIRQSDVQKIINDYIEQSKYRTATKIYQTLKAVFDFAVGDELIERSPMRLLKPPKYEQQNGCALTVAEERQLVELIKSSKCAEQIKAALIFLLYTGIRRSELSSACIEGDFVSVVCSKTRKGFQDKRRLIPITPMLAPWLSKFDVNHLNAVRPDALTQALKRLLPKHHLHDLRHTFITRCQECGVPREVVSVWAGHAADNTQTSNVYTHFSPEYMKKEAAKVIYNLE